LNKNAVRKRKNSEAMTKIKGTTKSKTKYVR
jgi:hypothetical protein